MPSTPQNDGRATIASDLATWLANPSSYPHPCARVELVSTHISLVALAGDFVYKLRRPVKFSYVDFSTLDKRRDDCQREIELNQRLAPGVHLGALAITRQPGGFAWEGDGQTVEYAVKMRRLPGDRMLASLLERRQVSPEQIDGLCDALIEFYRMADRSDEITAAAMPPALERLVEDNFADIKALPADLIPGDDAARISAALRQYLHDHRRTFTDRALAGAAVDGHGDLRAEHIYLLDAPVIIDRLEFNDRLRFVDIASDIAFLINDLASTGQSELVEATLARLGAIEPTRGFRMVLGFYRVLRGWVRAKVAATAAQGRDLPAPEQRNWTERARRDLAQAVQAARALAEPRIVAMCGLPASGKSSVAALLEQQLGMVWLRSDLIRKEIASGATEARDDLYADTMTQRTYDVLLERAEAAVRDGRSVVVDATFGARHQRRRICQLAEQLAAPFIFIECICPDEVLRERLTRRTVVPDAASDATIAQLELIRSLFEPVDELSAGSHAVVDTSDPLAAVRSAVLQIV